MKSRIKVRILSKFLSRLALVCSLVIPVPAIAQDCAYCAGKSPDQLIRDSVGLGSPALRAQIRAWLAKNHPNTGPGLTARAWIARSNNAPREEIVALYQQALDTDPSQGLAWTNLGFEFDSSDRDEEAVKAYIAGAKVWPEQPFFLEYAAQVLSGQLNDPQRTENMLRQAAQENWVARWIPDYVRGVRARTTGDRRSANQFFERALDQGGTNKDLIIGWLDNQLAMEAAQRTPMNSRMRVIDRAVDIARSAGNDAVLRHAGKLLWDDFDEIGAAYRLFLEAYQMRPTPEAAADAFGVAANDNFDVAWQSLERGLRDFPNNYLLLETAVWAWTDFRHQPDRADDFGRRAIAAAPTQRELESTVDQYANFARDSALYDRAVPIFESALNASTGRSYSNILGDYIDNRIYARDFDQAARLLSQARERNFLDFWLAIRDNRITSALQMPASGFFQKIRFCGIGKTGLVKACG